MQSTSQNGVTTLYSGTQLVVVDVVVTDRNQKPVHGLKASDFVLMEEKTPQAIKNFEEHTALAATESTKLSSMPKFPPGMFTNFVPEPANGAVNVLLLDVLNTPLANQAYVRQQLLAYLNTSPPGTRIAIFGLTSQLSILQGFTSDSDLLRKVASKRLGQRSPMLENSTGGGVQNSVADQMEDMGAPPDMVASLRQFEAQQQSFQLGVRVKYTLDAMNQIARYLSNIPGRKNLIWFSGSFPINVLPHSTAAPLDPFAVVASYEREFRDTVTLLARSQVAVYPIDARGLAASPVFDAETNRNYARYPGRVIQDQDKFVDDSDSEHKTMRDMATATGGHAFYDTNGLTHAVAAAITDGSNFYTLTYAPTNPARDGKFRKIKVQLARDGFNLAYRRGYYADDPDKGHGAPGQPPQADVAGGSGTGTTPAAQQGMRIAMMRGSPPPTEILMKIGVYPVGTSDQTEEKPAPDNIASPNVNGPFRRYSVDYIINPSDITFLRGRDGKIHADFALVIFVFNAEGAVINHVSKELHIASTAEEIQKNTTQGIQYHQEISTPAKGDSFLRIVVHDLNRDHFGAVEVGTAEVKNLAPQNGPQGKMK